MPRALLLASALFAAIAAGCTRFPPEPFHIEGGVLTVNNRTADEWRDVEIWINRYFRVAVPSIAAGAQFRVPLDSFVSGYAQRFDAKRLKVEDLRLMAKRSDGSPVTVVREPIKTGLAALERKAS
jgi:hypothetical protein